MMIEENEMQASLYFTGDFFIQVFREVNVTNFDASSFVTEQVFYDSKDGTKIPMFLIHKKVRAIFYNLF